MAPAGKHAGKKIDLSDVGSGDRPEAMHMDPQQRLLLERSWEALQVGSQPEPGASNQTAVFVGIGTIEYTAMASHLGIGIYMATGKLLS